MQRPPWSRTLGMLKGISRLSNQEREGERASRLFFLSQRCERCLECSGACSPAKEANANALESGDATINAVEVMGRHFCRFEIIVASVAHSPLSQQCVSSFEVGTEHFERLSTSSYLKLESDLLCCSLRFCSSAKAALESDSRNAERYL